MVTKLKKRGNYFRKLQFLPVDENVKLKIEFLTIFDGKFNHFSFE